MQEVKQHTIIKLLTTTLVLALLLPAAVKFNHVFENHKHEVCNNPQDTHLHNIEVDCEFYKFNLNTVYKTPFEDIHFDFTTDNHPFLSSQYLFVSSFQKLQFSLRGPPQLVL